MRKLYIVVLFVLLSTSLSYSQQNNLRLTAGISGGIVMPFNKFSSSPSAEFDISLDIENDTWLTANFVYTRLAMKSENRTVGGYVEPYLIGTTFKLKKYILDDKFFFTGGIGAYTFRDLFTYNLGFDSYYVHDTYTSIGFTGGVGTEFKLNKFSSLFVKGNYTKVFARDEDLNIVNFNLGVRFIVL